MFPLQEGALIRATRRVSRRRHASDRRGVARGGRRGGDSGPLRDFTGPKPTVLIVDADEDGREIVSRYLDSLGFETVQAVNAREALDMGSQCHMALIELGLPGVGGLDVAQRLKAADATAHVGVIVHTSWVTDDTRAAVAAAGIAVFVPKPTNLSVLAAQVLGTFQLTA
jgi:CheY-like chemotaxis protein